MAETQREMSYRSYQMAETQQKIAEYTVMESKSMSMIAVITMLLLQASSSREGSARGKGSRGGGVGNPAEWWFRRSGSRVGRALCFPVSGWEEIDAIC